MEEFRNEITAIVQKNIEYISDPKWDYAYSTFWNSFRSDLFTGRGHHGVPSFFSMWFRQNVFEIVEDGFDLDEVIDCVTSGEGSIGDRWLNERVEEIGLTVGRRLFSAYD
jgi:hypothetical protein